MSKCKICGRDTNRLNTTTFIEKRCVGYDYNGKPELVTNQVTYCNACSRYIERGILDGYNAARRAHRQAVLRGDAE